MKEFTVKDLVWTRPPRQFTISDEEITITTEPKTDLWQKTYYHFVNDNAPVLQMETEEDYFSFTVKTDFAGSHTRFDQCGIVLYQDSENWLKCSIEYENDDFQHLGSVVTNHGFSDWATTEISSQVKSMWFRLSRRGADYCFENSEDGIHFKQMLSSRDGENSFWAICLFARKLQFYSSLYQYGIERLQMAAP